MSNVDIYSHRTNKKVLADFLKYPKQVHLEKTASLEKGAPYISDNITSEYIWNPK